MKKSKALWPMRGGITPNRIPLVEAEVAGEKLWLLVDTGFNGYLSLPDRLIKKLGLQKTGVLEAELADGSKTKFDFYVTTVGHVFGVDDDTEIIVWNAGKDDGGAIGMRLLEGCVALFNLALNILDISEFQE
ncbi:MAG: aspartyl protease family protein [Candidatus Caldarchaeum sp.]